jgi:FkbM family methyltransferase
MSEDFSWTNVHVEEAALSSGPGERTLHAPGSGPSQRASLVVERADERRYGVRLRGLDEFLAGRPEARPVALIKCDVEGHELDVFRGAHNVLSRDRPRLLFECEARHDRSRSIHDVFTYLLELGYRGSFFWRGERRELGEFDVAMHQVPGRRHFANNFAFEAS